MLKWPKNICVLLCALGLMACQSESSELAPFPNSTKSQATEAELLEQISAAKARASSLRDSAKWEPSKQVIDSMLALIPVSEASMEIRTQTGWLWAHRAFVSGHFQGLMLQSKSNYLNALELLKTTNVDEGLIARYVHKPLGNLYTRLGDNKHAESHLSAVLEFSKRQGDSRLMIESINDLSLVLLETGQLPQALSLLQKGLQAAERGSISEVLIRSNLVQVFRESQQSDSAGYHAQKTIYLAQQILADPAQEAAHRDAQNFILGTYISWLPVVAVSEDEKTFLHTISLALRVSENLFGDAPHRKRAKLQLAIAEGFQLQKAFTKALDHFKMAESMLAALAPSGRVIYPDQLFTSCILGGIACYKGGVEGQQFNNLAALVTGEYSRLFELEKAVRSELMSTGAVYDHVSEFHQIGQEATGHALKVFERTKDVLWLHEAVRFMEYSRGILLAQSLGRQLIAASESNPLWHKLFTLETSMADLRSAPVVSQEQLFALNSQKSQLMEQLKQKSPVAFQQWFNRDTLDVPALLEAAVNDQRNVLMLFDQGASIECFLVQQGQLRLHSLEVDPTFETDLAAFKTCVSDASCQSAAFAAKATELYDKLVRPFGLDTLPLTIIPDGRFHGFPFELLCESVIEPTNFRSLPYLFRQRSVTYAPSLSFLNRKLGAKEYQRKLLVVQPEFSCDDELVALPKVTIPEADETVSGAEATVARFLELSGTAQVIHLATHGLAPEGSLIAASLADSETSWIALGDAQECEHDRLYFPQLQNRSMQSDLVVLQACQSASGRVLQGEGVFSIATSFLHAGSNNVIASRWDANPESSSRLLSGFYARLKGKDLGKALRQAQLDYLSSEATDDFAMHPYFWAGFSVYGQGQLQQSLVGSKSFAMWWIVGVISLLLMAVMVRFFGRPKVQ